jgi:hypothetical protein
MKWLLPLLLVAGCYLSPVVEEPAEYDSCVQAAYQVAYCAVNYEWVTYGYWRQGHWVGYYRHIPGRPYNRLGRHRR